MISKFYRNTIEIIATPITPNNPANIFYILSAENFPCSSANPSQHCICRN